MTNEEYTEEYFAKDDAAFARKFKRVFKILRNMIFGVIIAVAIFVLAFFIVPRFYAEYKCTQFGDQLLNCNLPLDSKIVAHEYKTANFSPAGDNMGFIVVALLESSLSADEIVNYLEAQDFHAAKVGNYQERAVEIEVVPAEKGEFCPSFAENYPFNFAEVGNTDNLYYAVIYDQTELIDVRLGIFFGFLYG